MGVKYAKGNFLPTREAHHHSTKLNPMLKTVRL